MSDTVKSLRSLLKQFPGQCPVRIQVMQGDCETRTGDVAFAARKVGDVVYLTCLEETQATDEPPAP